MSPSNLNNIFKQDWNLHVVVPDVQLHLVLFARQQQGKPLAVVGRRHLRVQQGPVLPPHRLQHRVHAGELSETFKIRRSVFSQAIAVPSRLNMIKFDSIFELPKLIQR